MHKILINICLFISLFLIQVYTYGTIEDKNHTHKNVEASATADACGQKITLIAKTPNAKDGTVEWLTNGKGSYDTDNISNNTTYIRSPNDPAKLTFTLLYRKNKNAGVEIEDSTTVSVTNTPAITINAGGNKEVCSSVLSVDLKGVVSLRSTPVLWSGGAGNFLDKTNIETSYTPTSAERISGVTLTLSTNDACKFSDKTTITFSSGAVVNAGGNKSVCMIDIDIPLTGSVTIPGTIVKWSGGKGIFSNENSKDTKYTPTQAERISGVSLTLSTEGNCKNSDVTNITFSSVLYVSAGIDAFYCNTDSNITLKGSVEVPGTTAEWGGGKGTFTAAASLTTFYKPTAAEKISGVVLSLSSTGSCSYKDDVKIIFEKPPIINAGGNKTICGSDTIVNLNGSISANDLPVKWSGGLGRFTNSEMAITTYKPTAAEKISGVELQIRSDGICKVSDKAIIKFETPPVINAGGNKDICSTDITIPLIAKSNIASNPVKWSGGAGKFLDSTALETVYTPTINEKISGIRLLLSSTGLCKVSDQISINFVQPPTIDAGPNQSYCSNSDVSLVGSINPSNTLVRWSGGTGQFKDSSAFITNYIPSGTERIKSTILTLTSLGTCIVSKSITISFSPLPVLNAGGNKTICNNDAPVALNGKIDLTNVPVRWSGGKGVFADSSVVNTTYKPTEAEKIDGVLLTLKSLDICAVTDNATIKFSPPVKLDAGDNFSVCNNIATIPLKGISSSKENNSIWSGGKGTFLDSTSLITNYTPTAAERNTGVTLNLDHKGLCNTSDKVTISILPVITVDAGDTLTFCNSTKTIALKGKISVPESPIVWKGGKGIFSDTTSLFTNYTPTPSEINEGVTLNLASLGNCSASDNLVVRFTKPAVISAGEDQTICGKQDSILLNGKSDIPNVAIVWKGGKGIIRNPNSLMTYYIPTDGERLSGVQLTLSTQGNCISSSMTTINFNQSSTVDLGKDLDICPGSNGIEIKASIQGLYKNPKWTSSGNGLFAPSDTSLEASYKFSSRDISNGGIVLRFNIQDNCGERKDSVSINFLSNVTANAGTSQSVCRQDSVITLQGKITGGDIKSLWKSLGTGKFSPSPSALNVSYIPSRQDIAIGNIKIILQALTNDKCNNVADTIQLKWLELPIVDAGKDIDICKSAKAKLNGKIVKGNGSIVWFSDGTGTFSSINNLNAIYTPSEADINNGLINIKLSSNPEEKCGSDTDELLLIIRPREGPKLDSMPDQNICSDQVVTIGAKAITGYQYIWRNDEIKFDTTVANPQVKIINNSSDKKIYSFFISVGDSVTNCYTIDTVLVTSYPILKTFAGRDTVVCSGSNFEIGIAPIKNLSYTWLNGNELSDSTISNPNFFARNSGAGLITKELTLKTGYKDSKCFSTDNVMITILPAPQAIAGNDTVLCSETEYQLGTNNTPGITYQWLPSTGLSNENISNPTVKLTNNSLTPLTMKYFLKASNSSGCEDNDSIKITISPKEKLKRVNSDPFVFCGEPFSAKYQVNEISKGNINWQIFGGEITNGNNTSSIQVNWNSIPGKKLSAVLTSTFGCNDTLSFPVDETFNKINIKAVTKKDNEEDKNYIHYGFTTDDNLPTEIVLKREPAFKDDSIIIKRISQQFDSVYLDNEAILPLSIYQYSLSFKGKCGSDIKSNSVPNILLKQEQEQNSNDIVLSWNSYLVRGTDAINYELWYKTPNNEYKKYNSNNGKTYETNYIKTSEESEICFKIKSIENKNFISSWSNEVCLNFEFNVPNAISPNGDGANDVWIIDNLNLLPNNDLSIFNQWNSEVFHKTGYQNNWGAENVSDGVYYYILKSNNKVLKGYILVHH